MRRLNARTVALTLALTAGLGLEAPAVAARAASGPAAAARLKTAGDEFKAAGNLAAAIEQYQKAITADPAHVPALQEYGRALYDREDYAEAASQFRKLAELAPDDAVAWYNLGYALRKQKDYEGASEAFQKYIAANPGDPDGYYALAECLRVRGLHEEAASQYELYVEKETRPEEQAWVEKAKSKATDMRTAARAPAAQPTALAAVQPAVVQPAAVAPPTPTVAPPAPAVAPPAPAVVNQPAPAPAPAVVAQPAPTPAPAPTVAVAQPAPAAAPLRTRDPAGAVLRIRDGDRMFQQKRFREALDAYQDAVRLDDQSTNAILKLGLAHANLGQYQEAIDRWESVLRLDPGNKYAQTYIERARPRLAAAPTSNSPKPVDTASPVAAAVAPTPSAPAPRTAPSPQDQAVARDEYRKAVALINASRFAESLGPLQNALDRHPTFVNAYVARGGAYLGLRRYEEAAADYRKSLELNSNLATPLYGLGRVYEKLGDKAKAIDFYRRYAASNAPDAQSTLKRRADQAADALAR